MPAKNPPAPRLTVYLKRGADNCLMCALEAAGKRRRTVRLLELIHAGLDAEAAERDHPGLCLYAEPPAAMPAQDALRIALRLKPGTEPALLDSLRQSHNVAARLRALAYKGLRREALQSSRLWNPRDSETRAPSAMGGNVSLGARHAIQGLLLALDGGDRE